MIKKLLLVSAICLALLGCEQTHTTDQFKRIEGTLLAYDRDTKVVYYVYQEYHGNIGYGYMTSYISENGNLCKYDRGRIVEIKK